MKIGFIVPILDDYDIETAYKNIEKSCKETNVDFDVIFAVNNKLGLIFTRVRNVFVEHNNIRAFMTDRMVNEHKLITLAMQECESYDATIIYSGKEEVNTDVVKAFISSWQAGNKIVYLKKVYRGFARVTRAIGRAFYKLGVAMLGIFKDIGAENDIQLLDNDVVKTINQLPTKNQLLRTLDSLIYYNTDIIHLEVDPNEYINPVYTEKDRSYFKNAIGAYVALAVTLLAIATSVLLISLKVDAHYLYHIGIGVVACLAGFVSMVLSTKKTLSKRVGKEIEISEYRAIKNKTEYYNFNK